jgi:hypothetical protein
MRPTATISVPRISVFLVVIGTGLVLAFGTSASPDEAQQPKLDVKKLEQKRLEVLEQLCDFAQTQWQNARGEFAEVLAAKRDLFAARLEYAETKQDRIKVCDNAIENARKLQELSQAMQATARGTHIAVLRAQALLLETQIARAKADAGD